MSDEERTSEHGSEDGLDSTQEEGHDTNPRYNLRPRVTTRAQERSHQTSPLYQTVMQGGLEAQSTELLANLRRTLADTARLLATPRMSVAHMLDGGRHRGPEDARHDGEEARMELREYSRWGPMDDRLPTWKEYHQPPSQQLSEGRRATERTAEDFGR